MTSAASSLGRLSLLVALILFVHASVLLDRPAVGALAFILAGTLALSAGLLSGRMSIRSFVCLLVVAAAVVLAFMATVDGNRAGVLVYLAPVVFNAYLAYRFARTLLPGREPLITRFCRIERGKVPEPLVGYTRRLTVAWAVLLGALAVEVAVLGLVLEPQVWSWYANIVNPAIAVAFFVLEYPYRQWRYGQFGPFSLTRTLKVMIWPGTWARD